MPQKGWATDSRAAFARRGVGHDAEQKSVPALVNELQTRVGNATVARSLQQSTLQRQTTRQTTRETIAQRIHRLRAAGSDIFQAINPGGDTPNCPALAAEVERWIRNGGQPRSVPPSSATTDYILNQRGRAASTWRQVVAATRGRSVVSVRGFRDPSSPSPEHSFTLVRDGGRVVIFDTSGIETEPSVVEDVEAYIRQQGFVRFEWFARQLEVTARDPLAGI